MTCFYIAFGIIGLITLLFAIAFAMERHWKSVAFFLSISIICNLFYWGIEETCIKPVNNKSPVETEEKIEETLEAHFDVTASGKIQEKGNTYKVTVYQDSNGEYAIVHKVKLDSNGNSIDEFVDVYDVDSEELSKIVNELIK